MPTLLQILRNRTARQDIIMIDSVVCDAGHAYSIKPAVVLSAVPCSYHVYSTDEPLFLFWASGKSYKEITKDFGNQICHFYQLFHDAPKNIIKQFPAMELLGEEFFTRVKLLGEE